MSLRGDVSLLVVLLSLVFSTCTSVSSVPPASYGLSDVTVQAGQDAVFRFNYDGELGDNDEVLWFALKTSHKVFSWKSNRTLDGFFANVTLPGQFDLVVRKATASTAGYYKVTVKVNGKVIVNYTAELRVVESVSCAALVDRKDVRMVCSVVFAHGRRDHHVHLDVTWSESATCAVSRSVEPEQPQRHNRTVVASTCVTPLDRLSELTGRTCTVTFHHHGFSSHPLGHHRKSSIGDQFSMECSVDVRHGDVKRPVDRPAVTSTYHPPRGPECYSVTDDDDPAVNARYIADGTGTVGTSGFWFGTMVCVHFCVKYADILS